MKKSEQTEPAPIKSEDLIKLAGDRLDPTDPHAWGGKLNIYTCDNCRKHIVTRDISEGVTPFMLASIEFCPNQCGNHARMTSSMYRVFDQRMVEDYVWYKPSAIEVVPAHARDHVSRGGLMIRKAAA